MGGAVDGGGFGVGVGRVGGEAGCVDGGAGHGGGRRCGIGDGECCWGGGVSWGVMDDGVRGKKDIRREKKI